MLGFISDVWLWGAAFYGSIPLGFAAVLFVALYLRSFWGAVVVGLVVVLASGYSHIEYEVAQRRQLEAETAKAEQARDVAVAAQKTAEAERDKAISAARANADALLQYRDAAERAARLAAESCARDRARATETIENIREVCRERPKPTSCAGELDPLWDALDRLRRPAAAAGR